MSAIQISLGNNEELDRMLKESAERAVKEALKKEEPIRPVVQQVVEKTVEHVIEGTAVELTKLEYAKTFGTVASLLTVGVVIGGIFILLPAVVSKWS